MDNARVAIADNGTGFVTFRDGNGLQVADLYPLGAQWRTLHRTSKVVDVPVTCPAPKGRCKVTVTITGCTRASSRTVASRFPPKTPATPFKSSVHAQVVGLSQPGPETEAVAARLPHGLLEYLKRFYADTANFGNPIALRAALEFFGADHVLFATDLGFSRTFAPETSRTSNGDR